MFLSYKLSDAEKKYYITKREALIGIWCLEEVR